MTPSPGNETYSPAKQHFLLLQMPCGAFGRQLDASLTAAGHSCTRIAFNGGDALNAVGRPSIWYRQSLKDWPAWVVDFARGKGITDLVCYGDCRHYHRAAIEALKPLGVRVHVLEEGYIRPNWVTCERDGVNGYSRLTSTDVSELPPNSELPREQELKPSTSRYCFSAFVYYSATFFLKPIFPRYSPHRELGLVTEAALWVRRFFAWPLRRMRFRLTDAEIASLNKPMHMVLLQLNGDSQIKVHSDFKSVKHFVKFCIAEFSASGATDSILVIKNHPLDNGFLPLRRVIRRHAERHGMTGRVFFVDGGKLSQMLERSISAVAVNSTSCHHALLRGIPTLLLGRAVFNHPQIVSRMKMSEFFRLRPVKDQADYTSFIAHMIRTCQFNGSFYTDEGRAILLPTLVNKLTDEGQHVAHDEGIRSTVRTLKQVS